MSAGSAEGDAYERAFVAMAYLQGRRGDALLAELPAPGAAARRLAQRLGAPEKAVRAQVLAAEVARIVQALDRRRIR